MKTRPEIVVRCWELNYRRNRPKADYYQDVKILYSANMVTATGHLVFPFEMVMDRPANPNSPETDFIILQTELEN
jgi:hypothetical protein